MSEDKLPDCPKCGSSEVHISNGTGPLGLGAPCWGQCKSCGFESEARFDQIEAEAWWKVAARLERKEEQ